jgi:hypothetical protein
MYPLPSTGALHSPLPPHHCDPATSTPFTFPRISFFFGQVDVESTAETVLRSVLDKLSKRGMDCGETTDYLLKINGYGSVEFADVMTLSLRMTVYTALGTVNLRT